MTNYKIQLAEQERLLKEDEEREDHRLKIENAAKRNDIRCSHYLNNYYRPKEERIVRNVLVSEREKAQTQNQKRKMRIFKKRKYDDSFDHK
jgi:hypothetical protein